MANHKSAVKRIRRNVRRRQINGARRTRVRTLVKSVENAIIAGDKEAALEHLEVALESTYNCINTLSDVARDQSDRGVIAVLNKFAYRPLQAELEELSEEID